MIESGPLPFTLPNEFISVPSFDGAVDGSRLWFVFQRSRLLVFDADGEARLPIGLDEHGLLPQRKVYLGTWLDRHCFAAELPAEAPVPEGSSLLGLREVFGRLAEEYFALAGRALQIIDWDRNHQFCGACATPTQPRTTERARECPSCGLVSYPRIAPAVMVLVRREKQLLLARSPHFAPGMYSALAGFVDPGESLERTIAREVQEEVGLAVHNVRYFGSQSWPFPHSLMIAFTADYASGELTPDRVEIEDAQWFDLENLPRLPGKISISRRLIDAAIAELSTP